ncbi:MAG: chemotaxis protein methyltransferase CheR [Streptosporangiaceae bacterium]|nr:chemotaxis protein methyltransferase CheR [Streptosporangiaceae bacterium]
MNPELAEIADLVHRETGIVLPAARETALQAAVARAAPGLDAAAFVRATADPAGGRDLVTRLIDEVTNQETFFARDRGQLDEIPWHALLQRARAAGSGTVRVWCAGCATGDEAYTLALLATQAFAPAPAPVDVLGTDVSRAALAAAAAGRYQARAVRVLEPSLRSRYFHQAPDGGYAIDDALRGLVRFRPHNLARDACPPLGEAAFDLITCRNVLIYFSAPLVSIVIGSLERSLRPGGLLVLGAADALHRLDRPPGPPGGRPAAPSARPAGPAGPARPGLRRPLGREPRLSREQRLAAALDAADHGHRDAALAHVASLLADTPLDADAHFIQGLVLLESGEPAAAAVALRRALCTDARFALAAFTLGRAFDALGDTPAAGRAYEQALRTLDPEDDRHERMLQQIDPGDIAAACRARLGGLREGS